ncbi:lipase isoform X3 [Brachypodium distachyon]|uniref:lipase isoform X3 n=1 Tax=Brachypodium distachyon TaxID=15368 RepID=UPI000D0CC20D|nr:lipase isoform X3 [Brachypodium distachyon]|eukprot:XP_024310813.1 lipase isoform X3 [Brachypodium distachyon]
MAPRRRTAAAVLALTGLLLFLSSPAAAAAEDGELRMKHSGDGYHYNSTLAHILVEYASAVYTSDLTSLLTWTCPRCEGHTKGFEMIEIIVDVERCLQAFVGVAPDPRSIIIAFRGTQEHSASNWIEDLFWKQLDVTYPGMPDAMVKYGSHAVELITFGQPRVGNPAFAAYFSEQVPRTIRVTHENDIVPHLPPYFYYLGQWTYHHFAREVWLHETVVGNVVTKNETVCDCTGEDPTCSRSVYGRSVADHLEYYGVTLHADSRGTCQFVIGTSNSADGDIVQVDGTIILSRYPQEQHSLASI